VSRLLQAPVANAALLNHPSQSRQPVPLCVSHPCLPRPIVPKRSKRQATLQPDASPAKAADQAAAAAGSSIRSNTRSGRATPPVHELSGLTLSTEASCSSSRSGTSAAARVPAAVAAAAPATLQPDPFMSLQQVKGFTGGQAECVDS
jgi:hypothetical protein